MPVTEAAVEASAAVFAAGSEVSGGTLCRVQNTGSAPCPQHPGGPHPAQGLAPHALERERCPGLATLQIWGHSPRQQEAISAHRRWGYTRTLGAPSPAPGSLLCRRRLTSAHPPHRRGRPSPLGTCSGLRQGRRCPRAGTGRDADSSRRTGLTGRLGGSTPRQSAQRGRPWRLCTSRPPQNPAPGSAGRTLPGLRVR